MSAIKKKKPASRSKKSSIDRSFQHQINKAKKAPNNFSEIIFLGLAKDKGFKELIKKYPDEIIDIFKVRLDMSIKEFFPSDKFNIHNSVKIGLIKLRFFN